MTPQARYEPWRERLLNIKRRVIPGQKHKLDGVENSILPWGEELPGSSQHPQDKAGFNLSRYRNNVQYA